MDDKQHPSSGEEQLTPNELLKKHISDPAHKVTESEIQNLKVGEDADDPDEVNKETKRREDEISHESPEDDLPNPYNIIES